MTSNFDDSVRKVPADDADDARVSATAGFAQQDADEPNYATKDVDTTPGSARPAAAGQPNYATTDVDPDPDPEVGRSGPTASDRLGDE